MCGTDLHILHGDYASRAAGDPRARDRGRRGCRRRRRGSRPGSARSSRPRRRSRPAGAVTGAGPPARCCAATGCRSDRVSTAGSRPRSSCRRPSCIGCPTGSTTMPPRSWSRSPACCNSLFDPAVDRARRSRRRFRAGPGRASSPRRWRGSPGPTSWSSARASTRERLAVAARLGFETRTVDDPADAAAMAEDGVARRIDVVDRMRRGRRRGALGADLAPSARDARPDGPAVRRDQRPVRGDRDCASSGSGRASAARRRRGCAPCGSCETVRSSSPRSSARSCRCGRGPPPSNASSGARASRPCSTRGRPDRLGPDPRAVSGRDQRVPGVRSGR